MPIATSTMHTPPRKTRVFVVGLGMVGLGEFSFSSNYFFDERILADKGAGEHRGTGWAVRRRMEKALKLSRRKRGNRPNRHGTAWSHLLESRLAVLAGDRLVTARHGDGGERANALSFLLLQFPTFRHFRSALADTPAQPLSRSSSTSMKRSSTTSSLLARRIFWPTTASDSLVRALTLSLDTHADAGHSRILPAPKCV